MQFTIILSLLFSIPCNYCNGSEESFATAIASMEKLLQTERLLTDTLDSYAELLQKKLYTVRRAVAKMRAENQKSQSNAEQYLSNPLNSFSLIRRMAHSIEWHQFMKDAVGEEQMDTLHRLRDDIPSREDLDEAAEGIYRLQKMYAVSTNDIVSGKLSGKQYDAKLSWRDSYTIGNYLMSQQKLYDAEMWVYAAWQAHEESDEPATVKLSKRDILKLYEDIFLKHGMKGYYVSYFYDRPEDVLSAITPVLARNPGQVRLSTIKKYTQNSRDFEIGCRGGLPNRNSRLHCRYNHTTSAFLQLAPLKMEEIQLEPYIVLFHDVISDAEIATLKDLIKPKLQRSAVFKHNNFTTSQSRTSKSTFLEHNANNVTLRLRRRIADMSGLNLDGSELFHVMNYGLGGHYDWHFDFFDGSMTLIEDEFQERGNRIATVLFYMSDVEQGGSTVFPTAHITILPRKGTAVMWYNLDNRGDCDKQTLHGACPVMFGSKWVLTQWIRERNQIFRRPCYK